MTGSAWSKRYGARHNPVRVDISPEMAVLRRARVYQRNNRYYAEVFDPALKKNVRSARVETLVKAIADALDFDHRVTEERSTGRPARVSHAALVNGYVQDLRQRAAAGEVEPGTVDRYRTALGHYATFTDTPEVAAAYPHVAKINVDFTREFSTWLDSRVITPNGHENTPRRRMLGQRFVMDSCRALFEWARDPERGNVLRATSVNPFSTACKRLKKSRGALLNAPDITTAMAVEFVIECDAYQLRLFAPEIMYGLRPGELPLLFLEDVTDVFLNVPCKPDLCYTTKGKTDKALPMIGPMRGILVPPSDPPHTGLLYRRRSLVENGIAPPSWSTSLDTLVNELNRRCLDAGEPDKIERRRIREQLTRESGAITYGDIDGEFRKIATRLNWSKAATLKGFRHHLSTSMENAGMPLFYRQFLMGHSLGRSAIVNYTHLNKIKELYEEAVRREWPDLLDAIENRAVELGFVAAPEPRETRHLRLLPRARAVPGGVS